MILSGLLGFFKIAEILAAILNFSLSAGVGKVYPRDFIAQTCSEHENKKKFSGQDLHTESTSAAGLIGNSNLGMLCFCIAVGKTMTVCAEMHDFFLS